MSRLAHLGTPLLACLTLGLAPFVPEPHLVEKVRWVIAGGAGMKPIDVFDLLLHGAPWVWLLVMVVKTPKAIGAAAQAGDSGGLPPLSG